MSRSLYRIVIVLALLTSLYTIFNELTPAQACSCSGDCTMPIETLVNESTFIVKATVLSTDSANRNGFLSVETYLKGSGGNTLLLAQIPPVEDYRFRQGNGGGDCNSHGPYLIPGDSAYYFLIKRLDGTYTNTYLSQFESSQYQFARPDRRYSIKFRDNDKPEGEQILVNEVEFIQLISRLGKQPPTSPTIPSERPFTAPILIKTKAGKSYLFPIDRGPLVELSYLTFQVGVDYVQPTPSEKATHLLREAYGLSMRKMDTGVVACEEPFCDAIQPNAGLWTALVMKDKRIMLDQSLYWGGDNLMGKEGVFYGDPKRISIDTVPGKAFLFSPVDKIAIWEDQALAVYTIPPRTFQDRYSTKNPTVPVWQVRRVPINVVQSGETPCLTECAVWSKDGTRLAFTDQKGLWLWDLSQTDSSPTLFYPVQLGVIPFPRYFTELNGYLGVTIGNKKALYRLSDNREYPDVILPPDEVQDGMFSYDILAPTVAPCDISCFDAPFDRTGYKLDGMKLIAPLTNDFELRKFQWLGKAQPSTFNQPYMAAALICEKGSELQCAVRVGQSYGRWYGAIPGIDFDYNPDNGMLITKDGFTLRIDREYNFQGLLDSPIVSAKWLPSQLSTLPASLFMTPSR